MEMTEHLFLLAGTGAFICFYFVLAECVAWLFYKLTGRTWV